MYVELHFQRCLVKHCLWNRVRMKLNSLDESSIEDSRDEEDLSDDQRGDNLQEDRLLQEDPVLLHIRDIDQHQYVGTVVRQGTSVIVVHGQSELHPLHPHGVLVLAVLEEGSSSHLGELD